ncbi:MAG: LAGLIDADG family homing endonuclease [Candidatus Nanohaloarchaea archaeon]|nr:LAGLIDADG family homing endonuclease [Candidatus Nanohaloarchaea archaeon]
MGEEMDRYELENLLEDLESIRGRNTELVSLYIPPDYDMAKIIEFLTQEKSEAENIKSKQTRKNVQAALDKIQRRLKEVGETPENGVAIFAGNVSEQEGRPDIQMWEVVPPEPVGSRRYRCDKEFVLEPLEGLVIESDIYGLVVVDRSEAAVGYLKGNTLHVEQTLESNVPGKTKAGGQCLEAGTKIPLPDGRIVDVEEMDETHKSVISADFQGNNTVGAEHNSVFASDHESFYRVQTKNPQRSIGATGNHRFFVFQPGGIREKFVEDIEEGDYLIGTRKIPAEGSVKQFETDTPFTFSITGGGRERLRRARENENLSQGELGEELGVSQTMVSKVEVGERTPSRSLMEDWAEALDINQFIGRYCEKEPLFRFPSELDEDFARFLGYFHGDGSAGDGRIGFYEERKEVADAYADLVEELFDIEPILSFREDRNYFRIRINNRALLRRLSDTVPGLFHGTKSDEIPPGIQTSPDDVVQAYLRGLFDAEGSVSPDEVSLSMVDEDAVEQVTLLLQRFGITASLTEHSLDIGHLEGDAEITEQARLRISDRRSLKTFREEIGFTSGEKQEKLKELVENRSERSRSDKIPVSGVQVRGWAEELGFDTQSFPGFNPYFRGEKTISYNRFEDGILPVFRERRDELEKAGDTETLRRAEDIVSLMEDVLNGDLFLPKVTEKEEVQLSESEQFYDIEVPEYRNFTANGIVVHNSQQRFERIRENLYDTFLQQVAEAAKKAFFDKAREGELLGIVVGGPGFAKDDLIDKDYLHSELEDKIIARKDTNYSGEEGLHELMEKSEDVIEESKAIREQQLVQEFLTNLKEENGLSTYGLEEVAQALNMGAVDKVLISEDVDMYEVRYECGEEKQVDYVEEGEEPECGEGSPEILEKRDIVDVVREKAEQMDSEVHLISPDSKEGQRLKNLGGIAAILRYRIS